MRRLFHLAPILLILLSGAAEGRVGLVTIPRRDSVQLTIYNSADITLVRESRLLTFRRGTNLIEFSWAGTLIDPTSLHLEARTEAANLDVIDVSFPPETPNALVWRIDSEVEGEVRVEISYFTSGLTWAADYEAYLAEDGGTMDISSFVKVTNGSGEEYEGAEVRLVVGTVHLVEDIADLARRGNRPIPPRAQAAFRYAVSEAEGYAMSGAGAPVGSAAPPEIIREGLSEYFLYTVSGVHDVPDGWSVRWPNFSVGGLPYEDFYRYEEGRFDSPERFLKLANDEDHELGEEPLPDGILQCFARGDGGLLSFVGRSSSRYIPVGEDWEIDLGTDPEVTVVPTLMRRDVENVDFDSDGNPSGWDIREEWGIEALNSRTGEISIEIDRNFPGDFDFECGERFEEYDIDTIRFARSIAPRGRIEIPYEVTYHRGSLARR